ncbi:unnamed protein product [Heterobilharzia americana]|nr:unnamed protein product [Heterobilharzia americana]
MKMLYDRVFHLLFLLSTLCLSVCIAESRNSWPSIQSLIDFLNKLEQYLSLFQNLTSGNNTFLSFLKK